MKIHKLKTWPIYFGAIKRGIKNYEIRKNDRNFQVGDVLELMEYDPHVASGAFTGRRINAEVTYMTRGGEWGLPEDMCVMSIRVLN